MRKRRTIFEIIFAILFLWRSIAFAGMGMSAPGGGDLDTTAKKGATSTVSIAAPYFVGNGSQLTNLLAAATATNASNATTLNGHAAGYFLNTTSGGILYGGGNIATIGGVMAVRDSTSAVGATATKVLTNNEFSLTTDLLQPANMFSAVSGHRTSNWGSTATGTNIAQTWSVAYWRKSSQADARGSIGWATSGATTVNSVGPYGVSATQLEIWYDNQYGMTSQKLCTYSSAFVADGLWHHIVVTHSATDTVTAWIDSVALSCGSATLNALTPVAVNTVYLFKGLHAAISGDVAVLKDIRMYSKVLTDSTGGSTKEVENLYFGGAGTESEVGALGTNLVAHWKVNSSDGVSTIVDSISANNFTVTGTGFTYVDPPGAVAASTKIFSAINGSSSGQAGKVYAGNTYSGTYIIGSTLEFDTAATSRMTISNAGIVSVPNSLNVGDLGVYTANETGGWATMTAGAVTVSTTKVTYNSLVMLTPMGTPSITGNVSVCAVIPGVSFDICSADVADVRRVNWFIIEPK